MILAPIKQNQTLRMPLCKKQVSTVRAFTILYAILIASLLLSIGVSIYSLVARDFALSAATSQSQIAIFAADTGYECALYWDIKGSTPNGFAIFSPTTADAESTSGIYPCAYEPDISDVAAQWNRVVSGGGQTATTIFKVSAGTDAVISPCAIVRVERTEGVSNRTITIDSRGYNTCDPNNPRRVERAIQTTYSVN